MSTARECFDHWRGEWQRIGDDEPVRIAFTIHEVVDERVARMRATSKNGSEITCRKGCAACCHLHVDVFPHEAELLLWVAKGLGVEIDWARLERQAPKDDDSWHELPKQDQRCVFLGDDNTCRVYEHRPGSCRKYHVLSAPALCDTETNPGGRVGIVFDVEAEIVHSAAMTAYGGGSMATVLLQHQPNRED
jgi:Fe-S-cluster containining protein